MVRTVPVQQRHHQQHRPQYRRQLGLAASSCRGTHFDYFSGKCRLISICCVGKTFSLLFSFPVLCLVTNYDRLAGDFLDRGYPVMTADTRTGAVGADGLYGNCWFNGCNSRLSSLSSLSSLLLSTFSSLSVFFFLRTMARDTDTDSSDNKAEIREIAVKT